VIRAWLLVALVFLFTTLVVRPAEAHKPSDAYLHLAVEGSRVRARWDISLRDLADATELDGNEDGEVTWAETKHVVPRARALAEAGLTVGSGATPCPVAPPVGFGGTRGSARGWGVSRAHGRLCLPGPTALSGAHVFALLRP
jgi:hypothetical protein